MRAQVRKENGKGPERPRAELREDRAPALAGPVAWSRPDGQEPPSLAPRPLGDLPVSGRGWQSLETSDSKRKIETRIPRHCSHLSPDEDAYKQLNWNHTTALLPLLPCTPPPCLPGKGGKQGAKSQHGAARSSLPSRACWTATSALTTAPRRENG